MPQNTAGKPVARARVFPFPLTRGRWARRTAELFPHLGPLALLVVTSSVGAHFLAGPLAIPVFGAERLLYVLTMILVYALIFLLVLTLESIVQARHHIDRSTRHLDIGGMWRSVARNPLPGIAMVTLVCYGATSASNLAEIYRIGAGTWHDHMLWDLESPVFAALRGSWLDHPGFWDVIYFQMWAFVIFVGAHLNYRGNLRDFATFASAIVIAFYLTRGINLAFPTAGPVFYMPGWFALDGTLSEATQQALSDYMAGRLPANGIYPATMAIPSLHVGLTGMAAWFLAAWRKWTLWLTIPWTVLIWGSTVLLGWHYIVDGPAGLMVAGLATVLARRLQLNWERMAGPSCASHPTSLQSSTK